MRVRRHLAKGRPRKLAGFAVGRNSFLHNVKYSWSLAPGKSHVDTSGERDLLLSALRAAAARIRLAGNEIDTIGISLRQKLITSDPALEWVREEGLLSWRDIEGQCYETLAICRTLALARAVLAAAVAEKPAGRFMIRSRTRVMQRHPEGHW